jgi:ribosome biogenesis GTPase
VALLTKPDLCADVAAHVAEVAALGDRLPVHVLNPKAGVGLDHVAGYLSAGRTGALLGSSGVGKSTIINRLVGEEVQKTGEVRAADSKGRHITTHRALVVLPTGGLIIDTPGMRELQLWDVGDAVQETFEDLEALAAGCRFGDCRHRDEPGCAVKEAAAEGRLSAGRLDSYHKLQDELAALAAQREVRARLDQKRQSKIASKALRQHLKMKRR